MHKTKGGMKIELKKSAVALLEYCRENEIAGNLFTLTSVLSGGVCREGSAGGGGGCWNNIAVVATTL